MEIRLKSAFPERTKKLGWSEYKYKLSWFLFGNTRQRMSGANGNQLMINQNEKPLRSWAESWSYSNDFRPPLLDGWVNVPDVLDTCGLHFL